MDINIPQLIPVISRLFDVDPSTVMVVLWMLVTGCNVASRLIPADTSGFLGGVRRVSSIIGIHVVDRIKPGVSIIQVATAVADAAESSKSSIAKQLDQKIQLKVESVVEPTKPIPAFPEFTKSELDSEDG
jgi:hypothetical protein